VYVTSLKLIEIVKGAPFTVNVPEDENGAYFLSPEAMLKLYVPLERPIVTLAPVTDKD
jgi:hypothetical protein